MAQTYTHTRTVTFERGNITKANVLRRVAAKHSGKIVPQGRAFNSSIYEVRFRDPDNARKFASELSRHSGFDIGSVGLTWWGRVLRDKISGRKKKR